MTTQLTKTNDKDDEYDHFTGFYKPEEIPPLEKFKLFVYNEKDGTVMGRTGTSWAKIGLFYLIFYAALASMFAIMLWVFFQTLDPRIPTWQLKESLIGTNPGLGFRPMPSEDNVESTLIWYRGTAAEDFKHWKDSLVQFLEVYRKPGVVQGAGQNIANCDYGRGPKRGQVCKVEVQNWHPCIVENHFNYHKSAPCVFLKLNKIYGWVPEYYNDTYRLPREMPFELVRHINDTARTNPLKLNTIWVSCQGENPADVENVGPIRYIPAERGFPGYYYPYENSEGYLSPVVAIHFERPTRGILIQVECKAWARNIRHDRKDRLGSVHFELMID